MSKVYLGDVGTAIVLDTGEALAGAVSLSIEVRKPNGSLVSWTGAVFETTKIKFTTIAGSIDQTGDWRLQAKVVLASGTWYGETATMEVFKKFQ